MTISMWLLISKEIVQKYPISSSHYINPFFNHLHMHICSLSKCVKSIAIKITSAPRCHLSRYYNRHSLELYLDQSLWHRDAKNLCLKSDVFFIINLFIIKPPVSTKTKTISELQLLCRVPLQTTKSYIPNIQKDNWQAPALSKKKMKI